MKPIRKVLAALTAVVCIAVLQTVAHGLTITANAHSTSEYDSLGITVPAGSYCSYYEYAIDGWAEVTVSGPGVGIDDITNGPTHAGGSAFSSAGSVTGSVYASGTAYASLTVGW